MSKKLFKEKQRFRGWEVIALLSFFIIGLGYRLIDQIFIHPTASTISIVSCAVLIATMGGILWYVLSLRLSVQVTEKAINLRYTPLLNKKQKIRWDEVEVCEIVRTSPSARWSGWNVHFDQEKLYSFNGRTGLHLRTKNGRDLVIGTRDIVSLEKAIKQVQAARND